MREMNVGVVVQYNTTTQHHVIHQKSKTPWVISLLDLWTAKEVSDCYQTNQAAKAEDSIWIWRYEVTRKGARANDTVYDMAHYGGKDKMRPEPERMHVMSSLLDLRLCVKRKRERIVHQITTPQLIWWILVRLGYCNQCGVDGARVCVVRVPRYIPTVQKTFYLEW